MEIMEFVNFLKRPEMYKELGAKIPKVGRLIVWLNSTSVMSSLFWMLALLRRAQESMWVWTRERRMLKPRWQWPTQFKILKKWYGLGQRQGLRCGSIRHGNHMNMIVACREQS